MTEVTKSWKTHYINIVFVEEEKKEEDSDEGPTKQHWQWIKWQSFLLEYFPQAKVLVEGYTFNGDTSAHLVKLRVSDESADSATLTECKSRVDAILKGKKKLPECAPPAINPQKGKLYKHPHDLFWEYTTPNFNLDVDLTYGNHHNLNSFLEQLGSQKRIQSQFRDNPLHLAVLQCNLDNSDHKSEMLRFSGTFDGLNLMEETLIETYSCYPEKEADDNEQRDIVAIQFKITKNAKNAEKVLKKCVEIIHQKAEAYGIVPLDWDLEKLMLYWQSCDTVILRQGQGNLFEQYRDKYETSHIDYKTEYLASEQEQSQSREKPDKTRTVPRAFFAFKVTGEYTQEKLIECVQSLRKAL